MQPQLFATASGMSDAEAIALCVVLAIIGATIVAVTSVVLDHFRKAQRDDMEATLKMELIHRGMTANDIKQVLEARMGAGRKLASIERLGDAGFGLVDRVVERALDLEDMVQERKAKRADVSGH